MTPQEHELVTDLFDRLAKLENAPRDGDAERAIIEGLRRAPNATYALVQTTLVQDEALKRADARIRELEARLDEPQAERPAGFLDGMRDALLGRREAQRGGSVPSVRPAQTVVPPAAGFGPGAPWQQPAPMGGGGSFLGTAAAAAAGVIGGSLLLDGIRSMMGPHHGAFGFTDPAYGAPHERASPWDSGGSGDLSRQAGLDDIGGAARGGGRDPGTAGQGFFDSGNADDEADQNPQDFDIDSGADFGGDGGGGFGSDSDA
jgi:hypothetical protein